jgi:predicted HAD superfamily phosphohydrolase YqeG
MMPLIAYVDVDDTLIRSVGTKRIPIPAAVRWVRERAAEGAELYCWSSGGADYARLSAEELGIAEYFRAFLPKPRLLLDDQPLTAWRDLTVLHPLELTPSPSPD